MDFEGDDDKNGSVVGASGKHAYSVEGRSVLR